MQPLYIYNALSSQMMWVNMIRYVKCKNFLDVTMCVPNFAEVRTHKNIPFKTDVSKNQDLWFL